MKYIKKFNEESSVKSIEDWCRENLLNYTINRDNTIDVNGDVYISNFSLDKLPIKFGTVSGSFYLRFSRFLTLEGCPKKIGLDFICRQNLLKTLKGCPKEINCTFECSFNNLESLQYCPEKVGHNFKCKNNCLTTLEGAPKEINYTFDCSENRLTSLIGGPKIVKGNYDCTWNRLISLDGAPKESGVNFDCKDNFIYQIYKLFPHHIDYIDSLDYNYLSGTNIIKLRFEEACEEAGIKVPISIMYYKYI